MEQLSFLPKITRNDRELLEPLVEDIKENGWKSRHAASAKLLRELWPEKWETRKSYKEFFFERGETLWQF